MLKYGIDIKTPTNVPGDEPWKPAMKNHLARVTFDSAEALIAYMDSLQAVNRNLELRAVEVPDDDPTYSV